MDVEHGLAIGAWHERGEAAVRASAVYLRATYRFYVESDGLGGNGRRAFIHSNDIAAVTVEALMTHRYEVESLPITGPEALTFAEVTARIGAAIGKPLTFQAMSDEEARQRYSRISGSAEETEAHVALWRAIREGRLASVTDKVEHILGRKPITLDQWLNENSGVFRDPADCDASAVAR